MCAFYFVVSTCIEETHWYWQTQTVFKCGPPLDTLNTGWSDDLLSRAPPQLRQLGTWKYWSCVLETPLFRRMTRYRAASLWLQAPLVSARHSHQVSEGIPMAVRSVWCTPYDRPDVSCLREQVQRMRRGQSCKAEGKRLPFQHGFTDAGVKQGWAVSNVHVFRYYL